MAQTRIKEIVGSTPSLAVQCSDFVYALVPPSRDAESLWDSDSRVRKFRNPDSDSGTKNLGLKLRLWAQNQTPTPDSRTYCVT